MLNLSGSTREAISYIEFIMRIIPMVSKRYQKLALSAENPVFTGFFKVVGSLPLDCCGGFGGYIKDDPVNAGDFVGYP